MALSARDRGRYARHLLLPEIGLAGQERLVETRVFADGAPEAVAVARTYLERAGVVVLGDRGNVHDHDHEGVVVAVGTERGVRALAGAPELVHAAAALAGAFGAVEAVKAALGLGTPAGPVEQLCLKISEEA